MYLLDNSLNVNKLYKRPKYNNSSDFYINFRYSKLVL